MGRTFRIRLHLRRFARDQHEVQRNEKEHPVHVVAELVRLGHERGQDRDPAEQRSGDERLAAPPSPREPAERDEVRRDVGAEVAAHPGARIAGRRPLVE